MKCYGVHEVNSTFEIPYPRMLTGQTSEYSANSIPPREQVTAPPDVEYTGRISKPRRADVYYLSSLARFLTYKTCHQAPTNR